MFFSALFTHSEFFPAKVWATQLVKVKCCESGLNYNVNNSDTEKTVVSVTMLILFWY